MSAADDDLHLVARVRAGLPDALEQLLRRHNRMLFGTARAILLDDAQAEEAVQDAYIKALRALRSFRGEVALSSWLARIVAAEALARRRKGVRLAPGPTFERPAAREATMQRRVEHCIDRLPELERVVFVMLRIERMGIDTASFALGIRRAAVHRRYLRALAHLRGMLSREADALLESVRSFELAAKSG